MAAIAAAAQERQQAAAVAASAIRHPDRIPAPAWLLLFDHRSLFDVTDADYAEMAAWEDALGSFGVEDLTRETFLANMSQRSDSEILTAMCPYTTKMEWPSVLNKKRVKISKLLGEWCAANAVPVPGLVEFLESCHREFAPPVAAKKNANGDDGSADEKRVASTGSSATSASEESNRNHILALWMTPWTVEQGQKALGFAGVKAIVAPVAVQHSQFALFDTLEAFGLRPPLETPEALQALIHYRTSTNSMLSKFGHGGDAVDAASTGNAAIPATPKAVQDYAEKHKALVPVRASTLNERNDEDSKTATDRGSSSSSSRCVYFTGSARNARIATSSGMVVVGVSYNCYDQESDDPTALLPGCDSETALRAAGCRIVVKDFCNMKPSYLRMI